MEYWSTEAFSTYLQLLQLSITLERCSPGRLIYIIIPNLKGLAIPIMELWDDI